MADGDVLVDTEHTLRDGTRIRLFAVESSDYPGGVNYRFQYTVPKLGAHSCGTTTLRCPLTGQVVTTATSGSVVRSR